MVAWLDWLRGLTAAARSGVSGSVVVAVYLIVAPVAWHVSGSAGLAAAAVAGACCWFGAICGTTTGLVVGRFVRGQSRGICESLSGMLLRMGIPLGVALVLYLQGGTLVTAGLLVYLLIFYPVVLAVETALSSPPAGRLPPAGR